MRHFSSQIGMQHLQSATQSDLEKLREYLVNSFHSKTYPIILKQTEVCRECNQEEAVSPESPRLYLRSARTRVMCQKLWKCTPCRNRNEIFHGRLERHGKDYNQRDVEKQDS